MDSLDQSLYGVENTSKTDTVFGIRSLLDHPNRWSDHKQSMKRMKRKKQKGCIGGGIFLKIIETMVQFYVSGGLLKHYQYKYVIHIIKYQANQVQLFALRYN